MKIRETFGLVLKVWNGFDLISLKSIVGMIR